MLNSRYTLKESDQFGVPCMPWANFTRHWRWEDRRCRNPDNDQQVQPTSKSSVTFSMCRELS